MPPSSKCLSIRPKNYNGYAFPRIGEFTDLEIQCGDQSWKVHKLIVCGRSTVFKAALTGQWKENINNRYRILDFEPSIVDRMLDFMYSTSYEHRDAGPNDVFFHSLMASVEAKDALGAGFGMNSNVASLFVHLEMNAIAEYYDVYQLRETATYEIYRLLTESWRDVASWYPAFLEATFSKTSDANLHSLLVDISLPHLDELHGLVYGQDVNIDVPASFLSALLGKSRQPSLYMKQELASTKRGCLALTKRLIRMLDTTTCPFCALRIPPGKLNRKSADEATTVFKSDGQKVLVWYDDTQTIKSRCIDCSAEEVIPLNDLPGVAEALRHRSPTSTMHLYDVAVW